MLLHNIVVVVVVASLQGVYCQSSTRCTVARDVAENLERVIEACQDELKLSILQDIIRQGLQSTRIKRDIELPPDDNEKTIAGCLLQCAYRKVKAVDPSGWPTQEGLVRLYAGGHKQGPYFEATQQAVRSCLSSSVKQRIFSGLQSAEHNCDFAYDMFECVSAQIEKFCEK